MVGKGGFRFDGPHRQWGLKCFARNYTFCRNLDDLMKRKSLLVMKDNRFFTFGKLLHQVQNLRCRRPMLIIYMFRSGG